MLNKFCTNDPILCKINTKYIIIYNVHNFCSSHRLQKYFNNKKFPDIQYFTFFSMCTDSESSEQKSPHDFGLHPSDAEQEVGWQMHNGGVEEQLVTLGHEWHPGRLLYYNRAELKQSDHR